MEDIQNPPASEHSEVGGVLCYLFFCGHSGLPPQEGGLSRGSGANAGRRGRCLYRPAILAEEFLGIAAAYRPLPSRCARHLPQRERFLISCAPRPSLLGSGDRREAVVEEELNIVFSAKTFPFRGRGTAAEGGGGRGYGRFVFAECVSVIAAFCRSSPVTASPCHPPQWGGF